MAVFKHVIRNFSGGILEDKREQSPNHFSITKHFDTFTYPAKLVPYAQTIASLGLSGGGAITALGILKFLYAPYSVGYRLFGLGVDGSANARIYIFDIDAGAANTTQWFTLANGDSSFGFDPNVFFPYKGFGYWLSRGTVLSRADLTGVGAIQDGYQNLTYTTGVQPVHHPSDDVAYFFGDNIVASLNDTTWNGNVLQLPTNERITSACASGDFLAIGTVTTGNLAVKSTVYLWDRDSSLTTLSDRVDFGEGSLRYLASLDSKLIGVMNFYSDNLYSLGKGKVIIKQQSGQIGEPLNEITTDTINVTYPQTSIVKENRLYFPMAAELDGDTRAGIWAVDSNGKIALDTIEYAQTGAIDGIFSVANTWWIAHSENGSVTHTDASGAYSASSPSVWETLILSTVSVTPRGTIIMNAAAQKKILGATVTTEPLLAGQSVTLKYRTDADLDNASAWTTIFTNSVDGTTAHSAINHESDQSDFQNYNEIQFRVESLGGAVVTGLMYGGETIDNDLY